MLFGKPTPQGYACVTGIDGKVWKECDTYTCVRCNGVIHLPVGRRFEEVATLDPNSMKVMHIRHADEDDRRTFMQKVEPDEDRDAQLAVFRRLTI